MKQIILAVIVIILILIFIRINRNNVSMMTSTVDNREYIVKNTIDKQQAADMLGNLRNNLLKLCSHLMSIKETEGKEYKRYIETLNNKLEYVVIKEKTDNSNYTSYSVNKGEEIIFCLRSKIDDSLHDINELLYVAIHEISHIACPEVGHTELFKKIFKFFLEQAVEINIYKYVNYAIDAKEYCGIYINETII